MRFELDKASTVPIYQRLADAIRSAIEQDELVPGEKLPTVRELSANQGIAGGTIRHAYDMLAREGVLDMVQGKGTFVRENVAIPLSRQKQAMDSIGMLLDELDELHFSTREMQMFFNLKLSERAPKEILIPVAIVDCSAEALAESVSQLCRLPGIELSEYLLEDVRRMPPELLMRYPLIVTTRTHYHELCTLLPDAGPRIVRMVLSPSHQTIIQLARIEAISSAGIYCRSRRFAEIIRHALRLFPHLRSLSVPYLIADADESLSTFLQDKQVLLVSPDYLSYMPGDDQQAMRRFVEAGGLLVPYHYQIDQGSLLTIEEKITQIARDGQCISPNCP